jgi:Mlc titration factor MtfA (ptsG expression regulator)
VIAAIAAVLAAAVAVLFALLLPPWLRNRRRRRAFEQPFPAPLRSLVAQRVPVAERLPGELRPRLQGLVSAFLAEKSFVGCNGLDVTDEMRVTIAAQACLLLLGRPGSLYDELRSILVYPSAFWVEDEVEDEAGVVGRRRRELSGEAWDAHRIVLSWEDVEESFTHPADGYNVVLHEFAHHLDAEGRGPAVRQTGRDRSWPADMASEFEAFRAVVDHGEDTFLDPYAAEDEAEFFAVASEDFIERPVGLRTEQARLYALMCEFYGTDPANWLSGE